MKRSFYNIKIDFVDALKEHTIGLTVRDGKINTAIKIYKKGNISAEDAIEAIEDAMVEHGIDIYGPDEE